MIQSGEEFAIPDFQCNPNEAMAQLKTSMLQRAVIGLKYS